MNVVVRNDKLEPGDIEQIFGPIPAGEEFLVVDPGVGLHYICARLGYFRSKKDAMRNGFGGRLPDGYSERRVGKKWKEQRLFIWNPTMNQAECDAEYETYCREHPEFDPMERYGRRVT